MSDFDLKEIQKKIEPLLGQPAWQISLGIGSFITFEFGAVIPNAKIPERPHGEWHLWIMYGAWCLQVNDEFIAGSEDPRPKIQQAVQHMLNLNLCGIELTPPMWETRFVFDKGVVLHLLPVYSSEYEHWILYMPDGNVLRIGPGSDWSCSSAD